MPSASSVLCAQYISSGRGQGPCAVVPSETTSESSPVGTRAGVCDQRTLTKNTQSVQSIQSGYIMAPSIDRLHCTHCGHASTYSMSLPFNTKHVAKHRNKVINPFKKHRPNVAPS